jgi:hypothetical protein
VGSAIFLAAGQVPFRFILQGRLQLHSTGPETNEVAEAMTTARIIASAALAALLVAGGAPAWEPLRSGPPIGARNNRNGFYPNHVAGPVAGKRLCPV